MTGAQLRRQATIEAMQYATMAMFSSKDLVETLDNFNIDLEVLRHAVDNAPDDDPIDIGTLVMAMITGVILERRRQDDR